MNVCCKKIILIVKIIKCIVAYQTKVKAKIKTEKNYKHKLQT